MVADDGRDEMHQYFKGVLLVLLSAFGFGLMPIFALYAYRGGINVATLLFIRFTLATALFLVYILIKHRRITLNFKDLLHLFILGGVCYTLQSTFYLTAVRHITPSLAALLLYSFPIYVVILSCIFEREKLTRMTIASIGVSFAGVLLILGTSYGRISGLGVVLALGAALVYSVYIMLGNRVIKTIPPIITSTFVSMFAGIGVIAVSLFTENLNFSFSPTVWVHIFGLTVFCTIIAILAFFRGIELLGPVRASILSMTEPLFTTISAVILLQDRLTAMQAVGGAAVLTGAILITKARQVQSSANMEQESCINEVPLREG
ncbi:MAG: DMT family transporter [Bacillota bacterium]